MSKRISPAQRLQAAAGFGCRAINVDCTAKLAEEFNSALGADGPTVIVVPTRPQPAHLG